MCCKYTGRTFAYMQTGPSVNCAHILIQSFLRTYHRVMQQTSYACSKRMRCQLGKWKMSKWKRKNGISHHSPPSTAWTLHLNSKRTLFMKLRREPSPGTDRMSNRCFKSAAKLKLIKSFNNKLQPSLIQFQGPKLSNFHEQWQVVRQNKVMSGQWKT